MEEEDVDDVMRMMRVMKLIQRPQQQHGAAGTSSSMSGQVPKKVVRSLFGGVRKAASAPAQSTSSRRGQQPALAGEHKHHLKNRTAKVVVSGCGSSRADGVFRALRPNHVHNGARIFEHTVLVSEYIIIFERDQGLWELCWIPTDEDEEEDLSHAGMDDPEPEAWRTLYAAHGTREGGPPSTGWFCVDGDAPAPAKLFQLQPPSSIRKSFKMQDVQESMFKV